MSEEVEYRCFIGGLSYKTEDRDLKDAFNKYGELLDAKVSVDKFSGRPRGFGFVTFKDKRDMDEAIDEMNGKDLDGRNITVEKAQAPGSGRDRGGSDRPRDFGRDRDRGGGFGGGRGGGGGGDCFKCGKPGHFARECPEGGGGGGGRYSSGRDFDRYGGGDRGGPDRSSRDSDRYGARSRDSDRDGGRSRDSDRDGGRSRDSDHDGGRNRDSDRDGGGDRYSRDRSGPYDRKSSGGYRS